MSTIYLQLIPRSQTLAAGDTITLRFPLDATNPECDLTISGDVAPLLSQSEMDYYVPDSLRDGPRLQAMGQTLYRWLDGEERFLTRAIDGLRGQPAVALLIEQGAGLDHLQWELLHDGTGYLVQQRPTAVIPVRWMTGPGLAATPPQNRPLHVAFMATAPQGVAPPLDFEGEEAAILTATQRHPLRLSVEESGNLQELRYLLGDLGDGEQGVDVVHLTGHATHLASGPAFLCEDEVGAVQWATAAALAAALTYPPRLLFLSGCRTGQAMRGGAVPSLAAALVQQGLPAVLGWGQPVFDPDATTAAATLYGELAKGLPLVRALAETYRDLLQRHAQNPQQGRHWHLLRLYARGEPPPPPNLPQLGGGTDVLTTRPRLPPLVGEGWGGVVSPLVTAPRTPGRARLTIAQREVEVLDEEGRVRVANRANFVGRRRVLQQCLAALRRDATALGVILYGLGGQGKSTLAHRLRQRWLQRSAQHGAVVLYGRLDENLLLRKLNNGLAGSPAAREALNSRDGLRFRLRNALTSCDEQLLIILDNFEDNFEQAGGAPRLVDGRPLLTGAVVQLLDDLLFALQGSADQGQEHRLLITSRYRPVIRFGGQGDGVLAVYQLDRLNAEAVQKKLTRLTPAGRATPATAPLRERATAIADGNPRLLEWLFELLAQETATTPDMDAVLARMAAKETALRENILAAALLAAQSATLRHLLARGLTCELPVPAAVFDALEGVDPALPTTAPERERATALGLLEVTESQGREVVGSRGQLRVPRILAPLLAGEEQPDPTQLAATAVRTLYTLWWEAEAANPSETQQLELHRLALAGGETAIAEEVADELAGRWNRRDQYRYREVIDLVTRTVAQSANARLWNAIGYAQRQLGAMQTAIDNFRAALAVCPTEEQALRGTILNNLGWSYDALGDKPEALRYYNLALPVLQQVGDQSGEASALNNLGYVYAVLGDEQTALRYYNLALPLLRQVGDQSGEASTLNNLGYVYAVLGDKAEALRYYNLALSLLRQVGDKGGEASTLNNLGYAYAALGNEPEALRYYNLALPLRRQVGDKGGEASTLNNIAVIYYQQGEIEQAITQFRAIISVQQAIGNRWGERLTYYNLGMIYNNTGRLAEAVAEFERVIAIDETIGHPDLARDRAMLAQVRAMLAEAENKKEQG